MCTPRHVRLPGWLLLGVALLSVLPAPVAVAEEKAAEKAKRVRRDADGYPLPPGASARIGGMRFRHDKECVYVAFQGQGKTLLSVGWGGDVRFWDTKTGNLLREVKTEGYGRVVDVSRDGKLLATAIEATVVLLYINTGKEIRVLNGHKQEVTCLAFSADGKSLLSGSKDKTVCAWEVATGAKVQCFKGHDFTVGAVAISPDGKTVVTGEARDYSEVAEALKQEFEKVRVWELKTGKRIRELDSQRGGFFCLAFSPGGEHLLSSGRTSSGLWDWNKGKETRRLLDGGDWFAFSSDGKTLVTGPSGSIRVWDLESTNDPRRLPAPGRGSRLIAITPDGVTVASATREGLLLLWDVATGKDLRAAFPGHQQAVNAILFTPDGKKLVSSSADKTIRMWDAAKYAEVKRLSLEKGQARSLALSPDQKTLAAAIYPENPLDIQPKLFAKVWDMESGKEIRTLANVTGRIGFLPDGKTLLAADRRLQFWDVQTGAERRVIEKSEEYCFAMALSADGNRLAVGGRGGPRHDQYFPVRIWDLRTGQLARSLPMLRAGRGCSRIRRMGAG